jgi:hypothetical protein
MEQPASGPSGEFIFLSRNSKLARLFQDAAARAAQTAPATAPVSAPPPMDQLPSSGPDRNPTNHAMPLRTAPRPRVSPSACPKLQAVGNPTLELSRPLAAALMREQAGMRCRVRGVLLDNEYVRDICAAGAHQHCPFLKD